MLTRLVEFALLPPFGEICCDIAVLRVLASRCASLRVLEIWRSPVVVPSAAAGLFLSLTNLETAAFLGCDKLILTDGLLDALRSAAGRSLRRLDLRWSHGMSRLAFADLGGDVEVVTVPAVWEPEPVQVSLGTGGPGTAVTGFEWKHAGGGMGGEPATRRSAGRHLGVGAWVQFRDGLARREGVGVLRYVGLVEEDDRVWACVHTTARAHVASGTNGDGDCDGGDEGPSTSEAEAVDVGVEGEAGAVSGEAGGRVLDRRGEIGLTPRMCDADPRLAADPSAFLFVNPDFLEMVCFFRKPGGGVERERGGVHCVRCARTSVE